MLTKFYYFFFNDFFSSNIVGVGIIFFTRLNERNGHWIFKRWIRWKWSSRRWVERRLTLLEMEVKGFAENKVVGWKRGWSIVWKKNVKVDEKVGCSLKLEEWDVVYFKKNEGATSNSLSFTQWKISSFWSVGSFQKLTY